MKKAAIYLRVSTTDQDYGRQLSTLSELAKALDYEVVGIFEEKRSAVLQMDTREELAKLRKLTKSDIDRVFIWDIKRLSRRSIDFVNLVEEFTNKGICLHFHLDSIISLDDNGKQNLMMKMQLYILSIFAQMDAENLKANLKSGKEKALLDGHSYTNNAPFGYYIKNKHLYIKENEAIYVKQAFELYKSGKSTQYIADVFNANNVPLKSKKDNIIWVKGTIAQLLKNTVYYGEGKNEETIVKADKSKNIPAQKNVRYFETPAIISKELFNSCRLKATENICRSEKSRDTTNLLRGLLVCGNCGKYYVIGNNNKNLEYRDGDIRANVNTRIGCKNGGIKVDFADNFVWNAIKNVYAYQTFKEKVIEDKERSKQLINKNESTIDQLQKNITDFDTKIKRLNNAYLNGLFEEAEFAKSKLEINTDKQRIEKLINELKASNLLLTDKINAYYNSIDLDLRELSKEEKKQVCKNLIEVVEMYNYGTNRRLLHIKLKIGLAYNVLTCTNPSNVQYCILDDNTVTFNNPQKALKDFNLVISDFTVTSDNNELFNADVFGEYSFMQVWDIMSRYNYLKKMD